MKLHLKAIAVAILGLGHAVQESLALSTQRNPLAHITRVNDPVLHAPSNKVHAYSDFEITFSLSDKQQKVRLTLEPNHDVLSNAAQINILGSDGVIRSAGMVQRADHKVYKGHTFVQQEGSTEWSKAGWARVTVRRDGKNPLFEGAFRIEHDHHHILTSTNYRKTKHRDDPEIESSKDEFMVVWRDSDIMEDMTEAELKRSIGSHHSCMSDELDFNADLQHPVYEGIVTPTDFETAQDTSPWWAMTALSIFRRQDNTLGGNGNVDSLVSTIGSTQGCPTTRKVALIGIATDCTYTAEFNGDRQAVTENIINLVNSASVLYEDAFNISLGIHNLTISDAECPTTPANPAPWNVDCPNADITQRLNLFSSWRGQFIDENAYWTLMSTCNTDAAVGLAWLGQLCQDGSFTSARNETIAGANVVIRTEGGGSEWQVFAHESGHTFGAVHDCTSGTCTAGDAEYQRCCPLSGSTCDAGSRYIMNPSTGRGITAFSQCTIGNICTALFRQSVSGNCLTSNRDVFTITGQQCGNGIVETGEDCDCGGAQGCADNPCCNPETCQFTEGSVCDPSNEDCCTDQCQLQPSGFICRASTGSCDPAETCDGSTPICPADDIEEDGRDCGNGLQCASGQCTSRDLQCRSVIGVSLNATDTYACEGGCALTCHSDSRLPDTFDCYNFMQNFLDGTPCDASGTCRNGVCQGANFAEEVGNFLERNKNIVIPVASVVGGLILILILACCISRWRRSKRTKRIPKPVGIPPVGQGAWSNYGGAWRGPTTPHRSQARNVGRTDSSRPGASRSRSHIQQQQDMETREPMLPPQGPPPHYTPYQAYHGSGGYAGPGRQQSFRYA